MFTRVVERSEEGASSVEYGLIVTAIAAVVVAIVFLLGGVVEDTYSGSCDRLADSAASASVISTASC
jgi:pilus assembly protein Flp/PilA